MNPAGPTVKLRVSALIDGEIFLYNTPIPRAIVPAAMMRYAIRDGGGGEDDAPVEPRSLTFRTNRNYRLDAEGRRHERHIEREIRQLEAQAAEEDALAGSLQAPLDLESAAQLQASHDARVAAEIAHLEASARRDDQTHEAAQEYLREQGQRFPDVTDSVIVSPNVERYPEAEEQFLPNGNNTNLSGLSQEPRRRIKRRYVKRGVVFRRVKDRGVRPKLGEPVFVCHGSANKFEQIGVVGAGGVLPVSYSRQRELGD